MSKQFRIQTPGGCPGRPIDGRGKAIYTMDEVDRINRVDGRRRVTGAEMEAMMGMIAAGNMILSCAPTLYEHAAVAGCSPTLKRLATQFRNLMVKLNMRIDVRQMGAIASQMADATITISANPVPAMVNIRLDDLLHICNRAMEQCDFVCTCTREESKQCQLRRALEVVPGAKEAAKEIARKDAGRCPYRGMEMEGDE